MKSVNPLYRPYFQGYLVICGYGMRGIIQQIILGNLSKPRRRRQRERHLTKTIPLHVLCKSLYISLYISLLSSAKQEREMTKFCVVWETRMTTVNFSYFRLELNAVIAYLAWRLYIAGATGVPNRSRQFRISLVKYKLSLTTHRPRRRRFHCLSSLLPPALPLDVFVEN